MPSEIQRATATATLVMHDLEVVRIDPVVRLSGPGVTAETTQLHFASPLGTVTLTLFGKPGELLKALDAAFREWMGEQEETP